MIEVEGLKKNFGAVTAIDGLTFSVEKGEVLGFLGPNGAGKTTTMRILTCFFPPTSGKATVAGFNCFTDSIEVRKKIGYLPENVPLYLDMAVKSYLGYVAGLKGVAAKDIKKEVTRVVGDCGIENVSGKIIGNLSKGYRQRVGLAQALIGDHEVLILDEPTIGLDPKQVIEIRNLIKDLAGKHTVLISSHILPEVSMICNRVVIIDKGRVVAVDTPKNLTSNLQLGSILLLKVAGPAEKVKKALMGVAGVTSVARETAEGDLTVFKVKHGEETNKDDLPRVIIEKGWNLLEMKSEEMSLEDIFIKLVTKEEGGGA